MERILVSPSITLSRGLVVPITPTGTRVMMVSARSVLRSPRRQNYSFIFLIHHSQTRTTFPHKRRIHDRKKKRTNPKNVIQSRGLLAIIIKTIFFHFRLFVQLESLIAVCLRLFLMRYGFKTGLWTLSHFFKRPSYYEGFYQATKINPH